jgi:RHS repeat-associated protein
VSNDRPRDLAHSPWIAQMLARDVPRHVWRRGTGDGGCILTVKDTRPGHQPFAYAGGLYDHETGLTRFGARDYDPKIGRWLAKDPIGFAGGDASLYSYVGQDPTNAIDPTGLATLTNNSSRPVWVAGENGSRAQLLRPGQTAGVDGVYNTPDVPIAGAPPGGAFQKLNTFGSWMLSDASGGRVVLEPSTAFASFVDALARGVIGKLAGRQAGWKSEDWLADNGWDATLGGSCQ